MEENRNEDSENNAIDDFSEELLDLFDKHDDRVPSLINAINSSGYNFSTKKIVQIVGLNERDAKYLRYALVALAHQYVSHHERLREHATSAKLQRPVIDKLFSFFSQLDKDGLGGLDTLFFSDASLDNMSVLTEITNPNLLLSKIADHGGKTKAYLPLARITMTFTSENNDESERTVFLSLDDLKSYIRYLDNSYDTLRKDVEEYRKLVGNTPIITGDN